MCRHNAATKAYCEPSFKALASLLLFFSIAFGACFYYLFARHTDFIRVEGQKLIISDLAYYLELTRAFWQGYITNVYEYDSHLKVLSRLLGSAAHYAMPLGVSPVALLLWAPLAALNSSNLGLAYAIWVTFSFACLLAGILAIAAGASSLPRSGKLFVCAALVLIFSSETFVSTAALGQTSIMAGGCLLILVLLIKKCMPNKIGTVPATLSVCFLTLLLSIKPTYLAFAFVLLLLHGLWYQALCSVMAPLLISAALTIRLGPHWPIDYIRTLLVFCSAEVPEGYRSALIPESMNLFSTAFHQVLGEDLSLLVTKVCFTVGTGLILATQSFKPLLADTPLRALSKLAPFQAFIIILSVYLLFAPYAGAYEDLLTIVIIGVPILFFEDRPVAASGMASFALGALALVLNHNVWPKATKPALLFWILKAAFLTYLCSRSFSGATSAKKSLYPPSFQ